MTVDEQENAGGKLGNAGKKLAGNLAKKLALKLALKVAKMAIQLITKLIALLLPYILPILGVLIIVILIFYVSYDIAYESRGKEEEYQQESVEHDNKKKKTEDGGYESIEMSSGNKIIKSFYAYYTQQSYFKVIDGEMHNANDKKVKDVKDKYNREKEFMLSPNLLWSLDEFLNNNTHRFPEQFIQPVHHDPKTYELKPLTNKYGVLTAKSQKYNKKTLLPVKNETVEGVWDYGFAPILQYKKYTESKEKRGGLTEQQVWNKSKQKFENKKVEGKAMTEGVAGYPKDVYMIHKVTSTIGTIENKIFHEWQNTGESWTKDYTETVTVDVSYMVKETRYRRNKVGLKLYYKVNAEGEKLKTTTIIKTKYPVTYQVNVKKWKKEKKSANRKMEGFIWSKEPRYEGEPDISKVVGSRYMEDYMYSYATYVPVNALAGFDLKKRTGKTIEGLEEILKEVEDDLDKNSEYDNNDGTGKPGTSIDVSIGGVEGGSDKFKKAMQYASLFQKYGEMYGVDPLLLAAKAAQERGGVHATTTDPGGALGIMQIQVNSHKNQPRTAFNYKTGKKDTIIASMGNIQKLETNIQIGTMIMQGSVVTEKYNPMLGLQGYNYGNGAMNRVVKAYASAKGTSPDAVRKNVKDTGWLAYRETTLGKGYGDSKYIENVLGHYPAGDGKKPYILDKDGNKVFFDGDIKMGDGIPSPGGAGSGGFSPADIMSILNSKWGELFPDAPKELSKKRILFKNSQIGDGPIDIINMSLAMTEGKYFSEYGYITPKMWKEKYKLLFSNPPTPSSGTSDANMDDLNKYFPNGYGSVVAKAEKIAIPYNGKGISIQAPKGSKVLALADGTVIETGKGFVVIDHGTGATSRYSTLEKVSVKKGDKVKKGATLGTSGANVFFEIQFDGSPTDPSWAVNGGSLTGVFITPASGRFTSPYGPRKSPTNSGVDYHYGVDIANKVGTPIKASASGEVIKAGLGAGGYGNLVHIKHSVNGKPMSTVYAHLSTINVKVGDKVVQGQVIAQMGNTGRSTGPHLHFEIQNGIGLFTFAPLDPAKYIKL